MNLKEYYDRYCKQLGDGKCLVCNKPTLFKNREGIYQPFCSPKCYRSNQHLRFKNPPILTEEELLDKRKSEQEMRDDV